MKLSSNAIYLHPAFLSPARYNTTTTFCLFCPRDDVLFVMEIDHFPLFNQSLLMPISRSVNLIISYRLSQIASFVSILTAAIKSTKSFN